MATPRNKAKIAGDLQNDLIFEVCRRIWWILMDLKRNGWMKIDWVYFYFVIYFCSFRFFRFIIIRGQKWAQNQSELKTPENEKKNQNFIKYPYNYVNFTNLHKLINIIFDLHIIGHIFYLLNRL